MTQTRTVAQKEMRAAPPGPRATGTRANVKLGEFTDYLLRAYDGVARRAYQKLIARGPRPGCELDAWLAAEHELGTNMRADVEESSEFVHALVSLAGKRKDEVSVAVEGRWLMILDAQEFACQGAPRALLSAMEWNSEVGRAEVAEEWEGRMASFGGWRTATNDEGLESEEAEERESLRVRWGSNPFCMVELPAEVDRARSVCVLADGVLALRMMKSRAGAD
jgi:HSP20 family molecular chaperone IbpA